VAVCEKFFGKRPREITQAAVAAWRDTGRWPTDMPSIRIVLAEGTRNREAYGLDDDDLYNLVRIAVTAWDRRSLWVPPPATDDREDIWLYICTCEPFVGPHVP
jgi:hypothetical protein